MFNDNETCDCTGGDIEKEFVSTEEDTMDAVGLVYMKTELCPTGGRDNFLRLKKSVVGEIIQEFQNLLEEREREREVYFQQ